MIFNSGLANLRKLPAKLSANFDGKFYLRFYWPCFSLSGPISRDTAILSLRYPISRDTFSGRFALPQNGRYIPPLVISFTQAHLCDTPFCNVSRDNCAIPHENKHARVLRYYRLQVLRDMKKYRYWASRASPGFQAPPPPPPKNSHPKLSAFLSLFTF